MVENVSNDGIHKENKNEEMVADSCDQQFAPDTKVTETNFQNDSYKNNERCKHIATSHGGIDNIFSIGSISKPKGHLEPIVPTPSRKNKKRKRQGYLKRVSAKVTSVPADELIHINSKTDSIKTDGIDKKPKPPKTKLLSRYYVFVSKYPVIAFVLASSVHLITIITTTALVVSGSDVFPTQFESLPLILTNDSTRRKDFAWRNKDNYNLRIFRPITGIRYPYWSNGKIEDVVEIILETEAGFIFSERNLGLINMTETKLFNFQDYQTIHCQKLLNGKCSKPWSILRLFDGTYGHIDESFLSRNYSLAKSIICNATQFTETKEFVEYFLEKDENPCSPGFVKSSRTRIFYMMGSPLKQGNSKNRIESYLVDIFKPEIERIRDNDLKDRINVYYISKLLFDHDVQVQAFNDMKLAIGSFVFIFLIMWTQTASFFITFFGIFSIVTSFLLTNLIYRYALKYMYFGFFHIIAMFIILGIGADDVFVFYDSWRLAGNQNYATNADRLADCYGRAAKSTFVTSITTASAFLVSGISPLLPVSSFGIFTGILVVINFLCDLIYFPSAIMLYSLKIKPFTDKLLKAIKTYVICICKNVHFKSSTSKENQNKIQKAISILNTPRRLTTRDIFPQDPDGNDSFLNISHRSNSIQENGNTSTKSKGTPEAVRNDRQDKINDTKKSFEERNRIVAFFINGFYHFITLRIIRFCSPCIFLGVSIFFLVKATGLESDSKQVQIFKESHNYGKASTLHYYGFKRNFEEEYTSVFLVWGIQENDMSTCNSKSGSFCAGKNSYSNNFDPNSLDSQRAFYEMCKRMDNLTDDEIRKLSIRRNSRTNKPEVSCFMTPLIDFMKEEQNNASRNYSSNMMLDIPLDKRNMTMFMKANKHIYNTDMLPKDFENYLEIGTSFWLSNKYSGYNTQKFFEYDSLLGEQWIIGSTSFARNTYLVMYYGTRLKYIGVRVNLTVSVYTLGYEQGIPIYEAWESLMKTEKERMPPNLQGGFQCTKNTWHWIKVQRELAESAIIWIIVSLCIACPILILTTMNLIIGILATICISLITTCVIGIIPVAGWKLGVLESLNLCMVVGLSVDYIVHLAEAYQTSASPYRQERVRTMLRSKGLSVLSGAITTFGAAIFLLFAQIKFLYQFGVFVMTTTSISLGFSLLGFTSLMASCGPQGHTGSIKILFQKCLRCCKTNTKDKVKSDKRTFKNLILPLAFCQFASSSAVIDSIKSTNPKT